MRWLGKAVASALVTMLLTGCGGISAFVATDGHQATVVSASGTVSIVHLTVVNGNTTVTAVTLLNSGASTTNFCGNLVDRFPLDTFVNVNFNPGSACGTVVAITVVG
jgi:Na+/proline symporter